MCEGYSTFILDDWSTSLAEEIRRIHDEFEKHLEFLIAGLKAVARGSTSTVGDGRSEDFGVGERFELLAGALEGVVPLRRGGLGGVT